MRSSRKSNSSWPPTTTTSARVANSVLFTIRMPASATWSTSACEPITNAAPRSLRSASTNWSAAPHVTTSSTLAWKPSRQSLRTNSSGAWRTSLVRNAIPLPASRSAATASAAPSSASLADPEAAVEVEQHVVVCGEGRSERHGRSLSSPPMPRPLTLAPRVPRARRGRLRRRRRGAARGGGHRRADRDRDGNARGHRRRAGQRLREGRQARAQGRRVREAEAAARPGEDLRRDGEDQLRRVRDHARRQARAEDGRLVRVPRRQGLLRRARLPPHRPRLRDPGRRSERRRQRRAGLLRRRGAARRT